MVLNVLDPVDICDAILPVEIKCFAYGLLIVSQLEVFVALPFFWMVFIGDFKFGIIPIALFEVLIDTFEGKEHFELHCTSKLPLFPHFSNGWSISAVSVLRSVGFILFYSANRINGMIWYCMLIFGFINWAVSWGAITAWC